MGPSAGNFTHPRMETAMMRREPGMRRSSLGRFGPRVIAFGVADHAALQRHALPDLDAWPTLRRLAVPVEGMVRIERQTWTRQRLIEPALRFMFICKSGEVGSAYGERQRRFGWSPQQERAACPSRERGVALQFWGHAMRHILEKRRRSFRLVTVHRADAVIGRRKARFRNKHRKRPILCGQAVMMHERFARRRKIAGFSHHAPDGGRCGAGVEPKRIGLHVRMPGSHFGIGRWSLP